MTQSSEVRISPANASFSAVMAERMQLWAGKEDAPGRGVRTQLRSAGDLLSRMVATLRAKCAQGAVRRLTVSDTVALGEKRFVALLKIDGQEFLIGGGSGGVSLLATLESSRDACTSSEATGSRG